VSSRLGLWLRIAVHAAALAPLALLLWALLDQQLGPDPVGELMRRTGRCAVLWLLLSLLPTVLRMVTGFAGLQPLRRTLGLYAFLYAALHFVIFAGLDYSFDASLVAQAIAQGRREMVGLVALVLLTLLAITSTRGWVRRLGRNWKRLHRMAYLAALLAVLHYAWSTKELRTAPILAAAALALLLAVRLPPVARFLAAHRRRPEQPAAAP